MDWWATRAGDGYSPVISGWPSTCVNRSVIQQILAAAERDALKRNCLYAHPDTLSLQTAGFYERLGYELFAVLEDYPEGQPGTFL